MARAASPLVGSARQYRLNDIKAGFDSARIFRRHPIKEIAVFDARAVRRISFFPRLAFECLRCAVTNPAFQITKCFGMTAIFAIRDWVI